MPPARVGPVGGPGPKPEATSENETQSPFRLGAARGPGLGLRERRAPGCPIVTGKGGGGAPHFSESGTKCRHMAWLSAALSPGQLPAWPSCPAVTRLRTQVGPGPVLGPRRSGQLRKLVTLPRADSQARARSMPTVPWPVPFLLWDLPPRASLLTGQARSFRVLGSLGHPCRPGSNSSCPPSPYLISGSRDSRCPHFTARRQTLGKVNPRSQSWGWKRLPDATHIPARHTPLPLSWGDSSVSWMRKQAWGDTVPEVTH